MDRRTFLKSTSGAATVAAAASAIPAQSTMAFPAPARIGRRQRLRIGLAGPDNGQGLSDVLGQFAARLFSLTNGAVTLSVAERALNPGDVAGKGTLDAVCVPAHALVSSAPEFGFFAGLPGRLNVSGPEIFKWLSEGGGQTLCDRLAADFNVKPLIIADGGPQSLLFTTAWIEDGATFAKKTILTHGLANDVVAGLGGSCTRLDPTIASGQMLAKGEIDYVEAGGMTDAMANGLLQRGTYVVAPGIYRHCGPIACVFNRDVWRKLPADARRALERGANETFQDSIKFMQAHHDMMRGAAHRQHDVRFVSMPKQLRETLDGVSDTIVAHVAAGSDMARWINSSFMAFAKARHMA